MRCNETFAIIGGDCRQQYLYEELCNASFDVKTFCVTNIPSDDSLQEVISKSSALILPIPYSKDKNTIFTTDKHTVIKLQDLLDNIYNTQIIYGGCFHESFRNQCQEKGVTVVDLLDDDTFELQNCIATAEGAITEAIKNSSINLHGSNCLVLGYGKCATSIVSRLSALNAKVTVCARNKFQQLKAYESGVNYINFFDLSKKIEVFDFIFNTVPSLVLTNTILTNANKNVTIIDIASNPGGTDFNSCKLLHLNAHLCLGLPGKYAPKTSAKIIYKSIMQ